MVIAGTAGQRQADLEIAAGIVWKNRGLPDSIPQKRGRAMRIVCFALALAALFSGAAHAADCSLKLANAIPLTMTQGNVRALVPVGINGTPQLFLLDTGGVATQISAPTAKALTLPIVEIPLKLLDMYGNASEAGARVENLTLGHMHDTKTVLPIMTGLFGDQAPFVGIFAPDYMGRYDVELDFAAGQMNYFRPDHCPGQVIHWPATAVTALPMKLKNNHLVVEVMLDGHAVKAIIDTGAPNTTLTAAAARRLFGVAADTMDQIALGEQQGHKVFVHAFQKMSFDGLEVSNPRIVVLPDMVGSKDVNNGYVTGSHLQRVDDLDPTEPPMLIGMNILTKLHLFLDFSEDKIYVTPASPPQAAP
jgi:predicted aspartyl protease